MRKFHWKCDYPLSGKVCITPAKSSFGKIKKKVKMKTLVTKMCRVVSASIVQFDVSMRVALLRAWMRMKQNQWKIELNFVFVLPHN